MAITCGINGSSTQEVFDAVNGAELRAWEAEASKMTADSYATEAEDVVVKIYTSNGDGTFTETQTSEYSALHYKNKASVSESNTAADLVQTNQDTIDTAEDLVQTNQDTIDTAADRVQTGLDRVETGNDVIDTNADVVLTNADVISSGTNATNAELFEWEAEAKKLTADSYATEAEDVFVKTYTSDGDGTFTPTNTTEYSSLHWAAKSALSAQGDASDIGYDNVASGLAAINVQDAIDELSDEKIDITDINNTLTSTSTVQPLSANMGKSLKDTADTLDAEVLKENSTAQTKIGDLTIGETVSVTSWSYSTTIITINTTAIHNLSVGQYFSVSGLVATTFAPNGRWQVATVVDSDTITFTAVDTPTGTPTVSSAILRHGDIEFHGAILGDNAITAFALCDMTTSPVTIIKEFNVEDIVLTALGKIELYYKESVDNVDVAVVGSADGVAFQLYNNPSATTVDKCGVVFYSDAANVYGNATFASIFILGGKA